MPSIRLARRNRFGLVSALFSCALFACGLWWWGWPAALVLIGFWVEEVVTYLFGAAKAVALRRQLGDEAKELLAGTAAFLFFAFLHLVFLTVFIYIDSDDNPASELVWDTVRDVLRGHPGWADLSTLLSLIAMCAGLLGWGIVDFVRALRLSRRGVALTGDQIFARHKAVLVMPHLTLLAGGFALTVLGAGAGLTTGVVLGKFLGELLLLPLTKEAAASAATPPAA
jgi:hypothetical protein